MPGVLGGVPVSSVDGWMDGWMDGGMGFCRSRRGQRDRVSLIYRRKRSKREGWTELHLGPFTLGGFMSILATRSGRPEQEALTRSHGER